MLSPSHVFSGIRKRVKLKYCLISLALHFDEKTFLFDILIYDYEILVWQKRWQMRLGVYEGHFIIDPAANGRLQ